MSGDRDPSYFEKSEIVVGIVCAVGVNYELCLHVLEKRFQTLGYETRRTNVSSLMDNLARAARLTSGHKALPELGRIRQRMTMGNDLRRAFGADIMGLAAIENINQFRISKYSGNREPALGVVHILSSFKRPEEIEVLRGTYGAGFYLIGIHDTDQGRLDFLIENKGISESEARSLMEDDQDDEQDCGQRTRDTYYLADVFVSLKAKKYKNQIERFVDLLMSNPYHTPTADEYAMFMAFAASLRSAQLGRQVGASIVSKIGDVIALGCNDVPKAGGGQYWPAEDGEPDARDHVLGYDSNDEQKQKILNDLLTRLECSEETKERAKRQFKSSMLAEITEFGRAMHAEMEALLSCARNGISVQDTTLYSTTFPCHNCARHILGAGVKRLVFIEPYVKSAAPDLHKDAITLENQESIKDRHDEQKPCKIPFESFVGIGPRRYTDLFIVRPSYGRGITRKINGKTIDWPKTGNRPRLPMHPISYLQREEIYLEDLKQKIHSEEERRDPDDEPGQTIRKLRKTPARKRN